MVRLLFSTLSFSLAFFFYGIAKAEPVQLVVVTDKSSVVQSLNQAELRQIYLGNRFAHRGIAILPLFNDSNPHIGEAFLQKALFMSHKTYQHYAAERAVDRKLKIKFYRSEARLLRDLQTLPNSISFISANSAAKLHFVKVVARL